MRLLLDTHIALWAVTEPQRLSAAVRVIIIDPDNDVFVSLAALWEIAIKRSFGRVRSDTPALSVIAARKAFADADFKLLSIDFEHVERVETLPRHHGDPFDRLIVAQALVGGLSLLTHDKALGAYGDFVMVE